MLMLKFYHKFFMGAVMTTVFLLAGFFGLPSVLAQANGAVGTVVATVEIYSASIVNQQGNQFDLSFDFFNKKGSQPDIKYAVQLFKNNANGSQTLVDEYIYPEVISLREGETKKMAITYNASSYLRGDFSIWLASKNSSGLPLAFSSLGKVTLSGSGQFIEIIPETCFLTIEGSTTSKKFLASQGVSVKPEQNLIVSCQAINHLKQDIKAIAQFQTFLGTSFGDEVAVENAKQNEAIEFTLNQQKDILFYLPKSNIPQTYEANLGLVADDKLISNKVVLRYAVAGSSATIENIIFDKDFYKKGETAQIQLLWSATVNQSAGQISFIIKDQQGKPCSDMVNQSLDQQASFLTLASPIIRDCNGPKIEATIKDSQGNVLVSKTVSVATEQATTTSLVGLWRRYEKVIFGAIIILSLALVLIITIRKKKLGKTVSLFVILGFFIFLNFLFFSEASATTLTYNICRVGGAIPCSAPPDLLLTVRFTDSLNKSSYSAEEAVTVTERIEVLYFNSAMSSGGFASSVNINGLSPLFDPGSSLDLYQGVNAQNSVTGSIGDTIGSFTAIFSHDFYLCTPNCYFTGDELVRIPYTVACIPLGSLGCSTPSSCCNSGSCLGGKCCLAENVACTHPGQADSQCCSGQCNSQSKCGAQTCFEDGLTCLSSSQCCTGYCNSQNKCGPTTCTANGLNCPSAPGQCCSGICSAGKCGAPSCIANDDVCSVYHPEDCCSGQCDSDGICRSVCRANNLTCSYNWQCCSDYCYVGRCKDSWYAPCPAYQSRCSYDSPVGQRVYDSDGILCPSGTLNTCPDPSAYCSNAVLFNSCGARCPQGTKNISQPGECDHVSLGYISIKGNTGPIKLNLISVADFGQHFIGIVKVFWKAGQPSAAADLVLPTDPEASPVRARTTNGTMAWKKWWPNWVAPPASCLLAGVGCQYSDDCCAKTCSGGSCVCKSNITACVKDIECCTGYCPVASKTCACIPLGSSILCQQASQCCSGGCRGTVGTPGVCCLPAGGSLGSIGQYCEYGYNPSCCSQACSNSTNFCL